MEQSLQSSSLTSEAIQQDNQKESNYDLVVSTNPESNHVTSSEELIEECPRDRERRPKTCDTGVILYVSENCFIQLDHKHAQLDVKMGVLDDGDCGRLEIIVKNKTDGVVNIAKGDPIAQIQFNKVSFPGGYSY
ncbi:unnamed protein product [Orchesella dallaii]|uniref:Uncharacterized protein n=1 Tax=Orchesella dallaii TaxID=48710 RepID=A0ABP1RNT4_9HEXA